MSGFAASVGTAMLFLSALLAAPSARASADREILLLHTNGGDLAFRLRPDLAPRHVAHISKLVRAGVYSGVPFHRLEPGLYLQITNAEERSLPFSAEQRALLQPVEFEKVAAPHRRGVLSMARWENDPLSARTSFTILLGNAPWLDGKYTVFAELVAGEDALRALEATPSDPKTHVPTHPLRLLGAEILAGPGELARRRLVPAQPVAEPAAQAARSAAASGSAASGVSRLSQEALLLLVVCLALFLAAAWAARAGRARAASSLALLGLLWVGFGLLALLLPTARASELLGLAIFLGILALIRLLAAFEPPKA